MEMLESVCLKAPVTALLSFRSADDDTLHTLVGQGRFLLHYTGETPGKVGPSCSVVPPAFTSPPSRLQLFRSSNVHSVKQVAADSGRCLVVGGKSVAIVAVVLDAGDDMAVDGVSSGGDDRAAGGGRNSVADGRKQTALRVVTAEKVMADWVWSCEMVGDRFYFLTAHNRVVETDTGLTVVREFGCEEKCILYSGLLQSDGDSLTVLSGSVFSQVLIWSICPGDQTCEDIPVLHRISGHQGVIFSIDLCLRRNIMTTTSDDRSGRVWSVSFPDCPPGEAAPPRVDWKSAKFTPRHTLYGHVARVFRSLLCDNFIFTIGEDSIVCQWNLTSGNLERKIENCHGGSPVWSLCLLGGEKQREDLLGGEEQREDLLGGEEQREVPNSSGSSNNRSRTLLTGGGDCAVNFWSVCDDQPSPARLQLNLQPGDFPKTILSLDSEPGSSSSSSSSSSSRNIISRGILVLTDHGEVHHAVADGSCAGRRGSGRAETFRCTAVLREPSLRSYGVMVASRPDRDHVLLANLTGTVWIFRVVVVVVVGGKAAADVGPPVVLEKLCHADICQGKIFSAAMLSPTSFLVNEAGGLLGLYELLRPEAGCDWRISRLASGHLPEVRQRWFSVARYWRHGSGWLVVVGDRSGGLHFYKMADGQLALVQSFHKLHGKNGVTDLCVTREEICSTGRDGTVRRFAMAESSSSNSSSSSSSSSIVPVSVVQLTADWSARLLFQSRLVVLFHGSRLVVEDLLSQAVVAELECGGGHRSWDLLPGPGDTAAVAYIKEKEVVVSCQLVLSRRGVSLLPGFHTQQVNCVQTFRLGEIDFVCTAGEDTLIRIHSLQYHQQGRSVQLEPLAVVRGHVSSVKCVRILQTADGAAVMVSGGGRAQLKVWRLQLSRGGELLVAELASHMLLGSDKAIKRPWRLSQAAVRRDPETRFLDLDVAVNTSSSQLDVDLRIYVACSDATLRVFRYHNRQIQLESEQLYQEHCILKVRQVEVGGVKSLLSCTTGGSLFSWDLHPEADTSSSHLPPREGEADPAAVRLHQSGINSLATREDGNTVEVVTGGDDNALVLCTGARRRTGLEFQIVWRRDDAHAAQITAVHIAGSYLVSLSIDQRVAVWELPQESLTPLADKSTSSENQQLPVESVRLKQMLFTSVADVHDAAFVTRENTRENAQTGQSQLTIVCCGIGLEIFTTDIGS